MTRPSPSPTAALLSLLLGVTLAGPAAPATYAADTPTCWGEPATIVTDGEAHVTGTPGDDVVVAQRAHLVETGAGADLVCVIGERVGVTRVVTGAGDDRVRVIGNDDTRVDLGAGADELYSDSDGLDVATGDGADVAAGADQALDRVRLTRSGSRVRSGDAGSTAPNADVVDAGERGTLRLEGIAVSGDFSADRGRLELAGDTDAVRIEADRRRLTTDVATGTSPVRATTEARIRGFRRYSFLALSWHALTFVGTNAPEVLVLPSSEPARGASRGRVDAAMRGGDDVLDLGANLPGHATGGLGRDTLVVHGRGRAHADDVALDLPAGTFRTGDRSPVHVATFESYATTAVRRLHVRGTSGPDALSIGACSATVATGSGADTVRFDRQAFCSPAARQGAVVRLGDGHDRARGTSDDDLLVGGRGRDVVDGRGGADRCRAEVRRRCER